MPAGQRDQSAAALPICGFYVTTIFFVPCFVFTTLVVLVSLRENFSRAGPDYEARR